MPARRIAGALGLLAAAIVLVAAFLPRLTVIRAGFSIRDVDLQRSTPEWAVPLLVAAGHALLYAISSVRLLVGRDPRVATGVLLGVGLLHWTGSVAFALVPNPQLEPGIAQWLGVVAGSLALIAALLGLRSSPPSAGSEEVGPPPAADWATGS